MRLYRILFSLFFFICAMANLSLKSAFSSDEHEHEEEHQEGGHDHEETGASTSFKPGRGLTLSQETTEILGLEVTDVAQEKLPKMVKFDAQMFGEKHVFSHEGLKHSGCQIHASGLLPTEKAEFLKPEQPVKMIAANDVAYEGKVVEIKKNLAFGESEVIVGMTSDCTQLKEGEFLTAIITLPRDEAVMVIPRSALLRTAQGEFVYVLKDDAYLRTPVKVGGESNGKIEIIDGVTAENKVVTKPVETLWLIELRATKGGGHSH